MIPKIIGPYLKFYAMRTAIVAGESLATNVAAFFTERPCCIVIIALGVIAAAVFIERSLQASGIQKI